MISRGPAASGWPGRSTARFTSWRRTPPPSPLPEAERGRKTEDNHSERPLPLMAPPLRFGEGAGGRGLSHTGASMSSRIARGCVLTAVLTLLTGSPGRSAPRDDGEPPPLGILQDITLPPVGLPAAKAKEPDFDLKGTSGKKYADREN